VKRLRHLVAVAVFGVLFWSASAHAATANLGATSLTPETMAPWYANQFDLSNSVALAHLETQEAAANIVGEEKQALGSHFGGVWFDNTTGTFHIEATTGAATAAAEQTATKLGVSEHTVIDNVATSEEQLEAAVTAAEKPLEELTTTHIASVGIYVPDNELTIDLSEDATSTDRAYAEMIAEDDAVTTKIETKPAGSFYPNDAACEIHYDGVNGSEDTFCNRPLRGAAGMDDESTGSECSINAVVNNEFYYFTVTAGHCVKGHTGDKWSTVNAENQTRHIIGEATNYVDGEDGDAALIKQAGYPYWETDENYVNIADQTSTYHVTGVESSYAGLYECIAGAQSTVHSHLGCGYVQRVDINNGLSNMQTETYGAPQPPDQYGDTHVMCLYEGDSGGPVLSNGNIVGVADSTAELCTPAHEYNDVVYYTEAEHVQSVWGVYYDA
jgi:hypothetical protein